MICGDTEWQRPSNGRKSNYNDVTAVPVHFAVHWKKSTHGFLSFFFYMNLNQIVIIIYYIIKNLLN